MLSSGMSNLADGVFKVALPLLAIRITRSPALVAGVQLVQTAPWLLGALHIGALVDRIDRRRAMVLANAARSAFVAVPAVLVAVDAGGLWMLYLAAFGTGVAEVFYDTAAQSVLPAIVPRDQLDRANGRLFAVELGAQEFAGPPLAGVLVAVALAVPLAASAGLWVIALALLATLPGTFRPRRSGRPTSIRADIREGVSFVLGRPTLRTMAVMVGMNNLASSAVFAVLVLFAVGPGSSLELSEPAFGVLFATLAAGGLVGGLIAERVQRRLGRARTITLSVFGMIAYVVAPALTTNLAVIAVVLFMAGVMNMLWNVTTVSFRQRVTPDHLLGRMNSAYRLLAWGTRPLGAVAGGIIGQWLGVRSVFVVMGILSAATLIPARRLTEQALADAEHAALTTVGTSRRPSNARPRVSSSAYSRSPPTGSPLASRVTFRPERAQLAGEVHRRHLALGVRVRAEHDLLDALGLDADEQLADLQLLGSDSLERAHRPEQHVVAAVELAGALDGDDVARLLDDAHDPWVAPVVGAERAELGVGDVEAAGTEADPCLGFADRPGQAGDIVAGDLEQVEGDPLRRLRADAGQPAELVDQRLDRRGVGAGHVRHIPSSGGEVSSLSASRA